MNNKGFSLPELLAVVAILGIISGIAVIAVTKHTADSKKQAYEAMETSIYNAAENYILENSDKLDELNESGTITIDVDDLISNNYLEDLDDPNSNETCNSGSSVTVRKISNSNNSLDEYEYTVNLKCNNFEDEKKFK